MLSLSYNFKILNYKKLTNYNLPFYKFTSFSLMCRTKDCIGILLAILVIMTNFLSILSLDCSIDPLWKLLLQLLLYFLLVLRISRTPTIPKRYSPIILNYFRYSIKRLGCIVCSDVQWAMCP